MYKKKSDSVFHIQNKSGQETQNGFGLVHEMCKKKGTIIHNIPVLNEWSHY